MNVRHYIRTMYVHIAPFQLSPICQSLTVRLPVMETNKKAFIVIRNVKMLQRMFSQMCGHG